MPKKKRQVEQRARQQRWAEKKRAAGLCPCCGSEKRDFNQRTGRPYTLGKSCRKKANATKAAYMARRRAAGRDRWLNERNKSGN